MNNLGQQMKFAGDTLLISPRKTGRNLLRHAKIKLRSLLLKPLAILSGSQGSVCSPVRLAAST